MDLVDDKAMLLRRDHAEKLMVNGEITGVEALAMIVCPPRALLDASRDAVREQVTVPTRPRPRPRSSFAELLASYA